MFKCMYCGTLCENDERATIEEPICVDCADKETPVGVTCYDCDTPIGPRDEVMFIGDNVFCFECFKKILDDFGIGGI